MLGAQSSFSVCPPIRVSFVVFVVVALCVGAPPLRLSRASRIVVWGVHCLTSLLPGLSLPCAEMTQSFGTCWICCSGPILDCSHLSRLDGLIVYSASCLFALVFGFWCSRSVSPHHIVPNVLHVNCLFTVASSHFSCCVCPCLFSVWVLLPCFFFVLYRVIVPQVALIGSFDRGFPLVGSFCIDHSLAAHS